MNSRWKVVPNGEPKLRDAFLKRYGAAVLQDSFTIPINFSYGALNA